MTDFPLELHLNENHVATLCAVLKWSTNTLFFSILSISKERFRASVPGRPGAASRGASTGGFFFPEPCMYVYDFGVLFLHRMGGESVLVLGPGFFFFFFFLLLFYLCHSCVLHLHSKKRKVERCRYLDEYLP